MSLVIGWVAIIFHGKVSYEFKDCDVMAMAEYFKKSVLKYTSKTATNITTRFLDETSNPPHSGILPVPL